MDRHAMIIRVGIEYLTTNIENSEYSYVQDKNAGTKEALVQKLGRTPKHFKLDLRFEDKTNNVVVLIETKQSFADRDEAQLREYVAEERALHPENKIICILADTDQNSNRVRVWKSCVDTEHLLSNESVLEPMEHYRSLFEVKIQNNREAVLRNTYALNKTLHIKAINEKLRSQFVGTTILYIKDVLKRLGIAKIDDAAKTELEDHFWGKMSAELIRSDINEVLKNLLDGSADKDTKVQLLQKNVLDNQYVKDLKKKDWIDIFHEIIFNIYKYINTDSSEGQDILNLFFIAFNKYTGKSDKNQAFTPDHITNFMCRLTGVDHTKRVFDGTCGSGSFLVQAMVLELIDCDRQKTTEDERLNLKKTVAKEHIFGIEIEDNAYGLSTTNMLIHGDGNSNIKQGNLFGGEKFDSEAFIRLADPDIILMNPPYNEKPIRISDAYKVGWKPDSETDPTKGFVPRSAMASRRKRPIRGKRRSVRRWSASDVPTGTTWAARFSPTLASWIASIPATSGRWVRVSPHSP